MEETRKILLELNFDVVEAAKSQLELKKLLKETNEELQKTKLGTEEYKKLEYQSASVEKKIKDLNVARKESILSHKEDIKETKIQSGSLADLKDQHKNLIAAIQQTKVGNSVLGDSYETAKAKASFLEGEIKKIELGLKKTTPVIESQKGSIEDLKTQYTNLVKALKEVSPGSNAMGMSFEDAKKKAQGLDEQIKKFEAGLKKSTPAIDIQKGSLRDLQTQYTELTKALREAAPGQQVLGQSFEDAKKKAFELKQEIKTFEANLGNTAPNVGNYKEAVAGLGGSFKEAVGGVQVFGVSLQELFAKMIANPIGIILASLALLAKMLMSNNTIADLFKGVMTGLGIVFDKVSGFVSDAVIGMTDFLSASTKTSSFIREGLVRALNQILGPINYIIDIMPALSQALQGDFKKAAQIAGDATVQFGKNMAFLNKEVPEFVTAITEAVKVGVDYEKALGDIEEAQSKLNIRIAELTNKRDELMLQSKDLAKTEEERIALNEKSVAIEKQILSEKLNLLDKEIKAKQAYADSLGKDTEKQEQAQFKVNDLIVKRLGYLNESIRFEEIAQNKKNALIEKAAATAEKAADDDRKRREKEQKDAEDLLKRTVDGQNKLEQFRLDIAAKRAMDIDEKLKAELKAEDFRVKVLLSDEKLLASEKEFILADSAARIYDINKSYEEKIREEAKKTADHKKELARQTEDQLVGFLNQSANTATLINDARLNAETAALNKRQAAEIKAAGNNKAKIEEINAKYDKKREDAERESAIRAAEVAKISAIINGAQAFTKSLSAAPFPFNLILAAGTAVATVAQIAKINSETNKLADGGIIKDFGKAANGIIIGGKPHSMGGTKFYGEDGSRFEAERGELLAVVNKRDTPLLSMLSNVNSIHGKPFFRDGGIFGSNYLADGGFEARASSQSVVDRISTQNQLLDMVASLPNPIVEVKAINTEQQREVIVVNRANV